MKKRALRHTNNRDRRDRGFTLLELMVTVAILVILLAIGAPQLQTFVVKRSVSTQADILATALRTARSEAIKRGQRVTVCPSDDPDAATKACSTTGNDWSSGWLVFVDNGTNAKTYDSGDQLLSVQQAFTGTGGIKPNGNKISISFAQNGLAAGDQKSFSILPKLTGSDANNPTFNACVTLALSGRVQVKPGLCPVAP